MAKEVRRIKAFGLSGLSKGPALADFPYEPFELNDLDKTGADGLPDRLAARQITTIAARVLTAPEQSVIALLFAFDGGPSRTEQEVARELDISRSKVANLIESAMVKLRRAAGAAIYSSIEDSSPCLPTSPSRQPAKVQSPASKIKS